MANISKNTSTTYRTVWKSFNITRPTTFTSAETFNGIAYVASTSSELYDRYYFNTYVDGSNVVTQYTTTLPNNYKSGTNIKVRIVWTSLMTTGNVKFQVGLSQLSNLDVYDGDSNTEYLTTIKSADSDGTNYKALDGGVLTFNGATLLPGEEISLVVTRNPTDAADTIAGTVYINHIEVYYQSDSTQPEISKIKKMTPILYPTLYKSINMTGSYIIGNAGTFNGLTCVASGLVNLNSRWQSASFADAAKTAGTFSFILPNEFKSGNDIVIELSGYTSTASTSNVLLGVGISKTPIGSNYVGETSTTYITSTVTLVAAFNKITKTFNFSSSGFIAGDILGVVVYREGDNVADTSTTNFRVTNVAVRVPINNNGIETIS